MFNKKAKIIFSNLKLVLKYAHSTSTLFHHLLVLHRPSSQYTDSNEHN